MRPRAKPASNPARAGGFGPEDFAAVLNLSAETTARFETWRALLVDWSRRINLVAPSTLDAFWLRHALDCAQIIDHAPAGAKTWLDMGAGAGFPGLAIALMAAERGREVEVVLVESNAKKAAFLREAVRATGAPARVRAERVEQVTEPNVDVITARALAPVAKLMAYAQPFLGPTSFALFLKGREVEAELAEAGLKAELFQSLSHEDGRIARIGFDPEAWGEGASD